jgi:hypothetical protein
MESARLHGRIHTVIYRYHEEGSHFDASVVVVLGAGTLAGPVCTRFASRSVASPSGPRFFSFSAFTAASFCACLRASLSLRSFSFRRALDSNSCQSPSSVESLDVY